jgi:hypothetical protein
LKGAISKEITTTAKAAIKQAAAAGKAAAATARSGGQPAQQINLGTSDEMLDLVRESRVTPILHDLMGFFGACHPLRHSLTPVPPRPALFAERFARREHSLVVADGQSLLLRRSAQVLPSRSAAASQARRRLRPRWVSGQGHPVLWGQHAHGRHLHDLFWHPAEPGGSCRPEPR